MPHTYENTMNRLPLNDGFTDTVVYLQNTDFDNKGQLRIGNLNKQLKDNDIYKKITKSTPIYIKLQSNRCGWCVKFKPEYQKFADMVDENKLDAFVCTVSAQENTNLLQDMMNNKERFPMLNVQGFPTVLILKNGKYSEYNGDRTAKDLIKTL